VLIEPKRFDYDVPLERVANYEHSVKVLGPRQTDYELDAVAIHELRLNDVLLRNRNLPHQFDRETPITVIRRRAPSMATIDTIPSAEELFDTRRKTGLLMKETSDLALETSRGVCVIRKAWTNRGVLTSRLDPRDCGIPSGRW
jgi:hypothetical protein